MKKFAKKALSLLLAVLMMFSLASFAFADGEITVTGGDNGTNISGTNITVYYSESGCYVNLTATVTAGYSDPNSYLYWMLPNTTCAHFVDGTSNNSDWCRTVINGNTATAKLYLTAVTPGITFTLGNIAAAASRTGLTPIGAAISTTYTLSVTQDTASSVELTPTETSVSLGCGQTKQFTAAVTYKNNKSISGTSVTWNSSTDAATVSSTGLVKASSTKTGQTEISATPTNGGAESNKVVVNVVPSVVITGGTEFDEGQSTALTASVKPSSTTYTWSSSNEYVPVSGTSATATVTAPNITSTQTATITCSVGAASGTTTVTAYPRADTVMITDDTGNDIGTSYPMTTNQKNLSYTTTPASAKGRGTVTWSSSDTNVATVTPTTTGCTVTAVGKTGQTTITCSYDNPGSGANPTPDSVLFTVSTQTKSAYDVPMSATNRINTTMSAAYTGIRNAYNSTYYAYPNDPAATITFSSIPRTCGTLYTSAGYTSPAAEKTAYSFSSLSSMSYSPSTVGTEILTYTLANGTNYLTGRIVITVNAPGSTVVVNLDGSDPYTFSYATSRDGRSADASIYNTIFSATGKTYSYLIFDPVSSAVGTLYGSSSGTAVTANTPYYYSGAISTNTVSRLYFVPSNTGTYTRSFRAYLSDSTQIFSGTLQLVVPSKPADAAVSYSTPISSTLAMNETDFVRWYESQTSSSYFLSSVTFNSVQYSNSAYPGYFQHASSTFTPGNGVSYYTSTYNGTANYAENYLSKVTYHSPSVTCWLRVDFTCCGGAYRDSLNLRKSGTMYICVTRNAVPDIRYTVSRGTSKALAAADFVNAYKTAMNVSSVGSFYVQFLNVPSMGSLSVGYVNAYYPGTTLNAANVNSSNFYVNYTGSAYSISNVSYVPGYYQSNTDTVKYAAYSLNSQLLYIGEIGFLYGTGTGSDCYSDGYSFSSASFYSASDADPVYSVTFSQPATGTLYYNYAHGIGTAVTNSVKFYTKYSGYGTLPVSSVVYIPRMSYSGTVSIPYTTTTASGRTTSASLILSVGSKTASSLFYDVTPANTGSWSANSVDFACKWGLISGTGTYTFSPNTYMSRGMLATVLYSAAGKPNTSGTLPFTDVKYTDYYYNAILWAYNNGVVSGKTATAFAPGANVTREQFAAILYAFASRAGRDMSTGGSLYGYSDAGSVSGYARTAMQWAVYHGYISGTGNNRLNPKGYATRAQAVVMLHSYLTK